MRSFVLLALVAVTIASVAEARPIKPAHREIRASVSGGVVSFSGSAARRMKSGPTIGGDLGIALSPRITAGMRLDIGFPPSKINTIGPLGTPIGDTWTWYSGGLFGEYLIGGSRLSPIIGGRVSVGGTHISYTQDLNGTSGQGNFGVGYGMYLGLRYRPTQRFSGVLDVGAERSPATTTGWYYPARMGLAVFL